MAAATSLIQLILKKWGDDAAGAARELEEKVGFPESVANRIATGELPMDAKSVAKRSQDQGYGDTLYHGSVNDINNLDPSFQGMTNPDASGTGLWMSDEPDVANSFAGDEDYLGGVLYPLRVRSSNPASIDANGGHWEAIPTEVGMKVGDSLLELDGGTLDSNRLAKIAKEEGADSLTFNDMTDGGIFYYGHEKAFDPSKVVASLRTDNVRSANAAFDPEYSGPNIMGGLLAGGVGLGALGQSEDADAGFVTRGGRTLLEAWHGSPHKFDKFSMDQIGTGEGAQAYGHGLYFADSEDVARQYRDQLRHRGGEDFEDVAKRNGVDPSAFNGYGPHSAEARINEGASLKTIVTEAKMANRALRDTPDEQVAQTIQEYLDGKSGALYRTEIDVTPESLLDWDKPLSADTPQQMKDAINTLVKNNPDLKDDLYQAYREDQPGSIYYSLLSDHAKTGDIVKNQQFATQQLNDAGIKGIKYLDGDSRAVGDGTSNYVIFDDSLINIAERGNADPRLLAGTAAGTALGALAAPMVKDSGMISSPRAGWLWDTTMALRDVERRLEGNPASLLFPSGLVDYLETTNRREEKPNAETAAWALLDVLPW